jgi:hypothetical protein
MPSSSSSSLLWGGVGGGMTRSSITSAKSRGKAPASAKTAASRQLAALSSAAAEEAAVGVNSVAWGDGSARSNLTRPRSISPGIRGAHMSVVSSFPPTSSQRERDGSCNKRDAPPQLNGAAPPENPWVEFTAKRDGWWRSVPWNIDFELIPKWKRPWSQGSAGGSGLHLQHGGGASSKEGTPGDFHYHGGGEDRRHHHLTHTRDFDDVNAGFVEEGSFLSSAHHHDGGLPLDGEPPRKNSRENSHIHHSDDDFRGDDAEAKMMRHNGDDDAGFFDQCDHNSSTSMDAKNFARGDADACSISDFDQYTKNNNNGDFEGQDAALLLRAEESHHHHVQNDDQRSKAPAAPATGGREGATSQKGASCDDHQVARVKGALITIHSNAHTDAPTHQQRAKHDAAADTDTRNEKDHVPAHTNTIINTPAHQHQRANHASAGSNYGGVSLSGRAHLRDILSVKSAHPSHQDANSSKIKMSESEFVPRLRDERRGATPTLGAPRQQQHMEAHVHIHRAQSPARAGSFDQGNNNNNQTGYVRDKTADNGRPWTQGNGKSTIISGQNGGKSFGTTTGSKNGGKLGQWRARLPGWETEYLAVVSPPIIGGNL